MLDERYIEMIDDYLDGILDQNEKEKLEAELKENQELRDFMALIKLTRESIKMSGQKEMIQQVHEEYIKESKDEINIEKPKSFRISPWWLGVAASISLFILIGNFWIKTQTENLFDENYIAYNLPTMRSTESLENELTILFKDADYEAIIKIIDLGSENSNELFLAGISHFELENYKESIQYLKKIQLINETKVDSSHVFQDESDYYLFLAYLKMENLTDADRYYSKITTDMNHTYHKNINLQDKLKFNILKLKN